MRLIDRFSRRRYGLEQLSYAGTTYTLPVSYMMPGSKRESVDPSFEAYVEQVGYTGSVVAAAVTARALILSQLRFGYRNVSDGLEGQLYGSQLLAPLESPDGMTRPQLLMLAEQHASYGGSAYFHLNAGRLRLLRPDWVSVLMSSDAEPDEPFTSYDYRVEAYLFYPGGIYARRSPIMFRPDEIAAWAPEPDPLAPWRGQSWVTSVMTEILTDRQANDHLAKFFENGATPQIIFSMPETMTAEAVKQYMQVQDQRSSGTANAYKNMYVGGGAQPTVVGSQLGQLDYKNLQGGNETRIALRARIPAVVLGIREGLAGSSLNAGNYISARRMWSDGWVSPTADGLCAALAPLIGAPNPMSELTWDPSRITFMQEDRADEASIRQMNANTLRSLLDAGYDADTAVDAVRTGDFSLLKHSGLFSVQLQPPGSVEPPSDNAMPDNMPVDGASA